MYVTASDVHLTHGPGYRVTSYIRVHPQDRVLALEARAVAVPQGFTWLSLALGREEGPARAQAGNEPLRYALVCHGM